jgi:hypothetical protein
MHASIHPSIHPTAEPRKSVVPESAAGFRRWPVRVVRLGTPTISATVPYRNPALQQKPHSFFNSTSTYPLLLGRPDKRTSDKRTEGKAAEGDSFEVCTSGCEAFSPLVVHTFLMCVVQKTSAAETTSH